jgi:flagellar M-ring protein FliF
MATPLPPVLIDTVRRMNGGTRRFVGLAVIAVALALLWSASRWAAGPTYVTLYRELELSSVSSITESLTKAGVSYRLENGGSEVLVPVDEVARARVLLAKDGLPANGRPGMELFDKPTWGMTDFTQRITYRRALEGELARTIGTLRGVERAQVHLALPESSPLRKLDRPAEAAVVLTVRPGAVLSPEIVQGVAYIVSNSVEQLPPQNVAVMDDTGRLLSSPADNGSAPLGLSTRQLDLQRSVEKQMADKVDGLLGTVLGPGHTRVQVAATLNFEQVEKTVESYDPDGQVLSTEQRSETTGDAAGTGAGGNQTVISNAYSNSKKVERILGATGNVSRLTVAVLVDRKALGKSAPGSTPAPGVSDSILASLNGAIRNAIGFDSTRGDRLTVTAIPFEVDSSVLAKLPAEAPPRRDMLVVAERFSRPTVLLVGIVAALVLGLRLLKAPPPAAGARAGGAFAAAGPGAPALPPEEPAILTASQQLRSRVQQESTNHPSTAAQVMRAWMAES